MSGVEPTYAPLRAAVFSPFRASFFHCLRFLYYPHFFLLFSFPLSVPHRYLELTQRSELSLQCSPALSRFSLTLSFLFYLLPLLCLCSSLSLSLSNTWNRPNVPTPPFCGFPFARPSSTLSLSYSIFPFFLPLFFSFLRPP